MAELVIDTGAANALGIQGGITAPVVPATPGNPAAWHNGVDSETLGMLQNKGWADKPANEAALALVKSYQEATKLIGVAPDKVIRIPEITDADGWKKVYEKLGAPADGSYDFSGLKTAKGDALDADLAGFLKTAATEAHMPKDVALKVAGELVKHIDKLDASNAAIKQAALQAEREGLQKNWGQNFESNKHVASQAAQALGVTPEHITALEGVIGYSKVMEMFRNIGARIGEDRFVSSGPGGGGGTVSVDQARAQLKELKGDPAWGKRYLAGGVEEGRQFRALTTIIASAATDR